MLIQRHGALKKVSDDTIGDYYVLDEELSSDALKTLFGAFRFPLATITKIEMKTGYADMGLSSIADKTWFCYTPIQGKPCGKCHPCQYTIEEGMKERFTTMALLRYQLHTKVRPLIARIPGAKKLKSFISKILK